MVGSTKQACPPVKPLMNGGMKDEVINIRMNEWVDELMNG